MLPEERVNTCGQIQNSKTGRCMYTAVVARGRPAVTTMESSELSFASVFDQLQDLDQLPSAAAKVSALAVLVANIHASSSSTAGPRVLVQDSLCQALLKTLQRHPTQPSTFHAAAAHPASSSPSQHNTANTPDSQQHLQSAAAAAAAAAASSASLAQAWTTAAPALQLIYGWEDEQVVLSVIAFWQQVASLLCGSWLQQQQRAQPSGSQGTSFHLQLQANLTTAPAPPTPSTSRHSTAPSAAVPPTSSSSTTEPEVQYLAWLWSLGPAAVAAVVDMMHRFNMLTSLSPLQHKHNSSTQQRDRAAATTHQLINLLLLFLDLHHPNSNSNSSSGSSEARSSCQAATQLLQLLYHGAGPNMPCTVAAAIPAGEAFAGVCCVLQAAAALGITLPPPPSSATSPHLHDASPTDGTSTTPTAAAVAAGSQPGPQPGVTAWPLLAEAAGKLLRGGYGWCGFGEAANASPAAAAAAAEAARQAAAGFVVGRSSSSSTAAAAARPGSLESLYDCFMMLLLQQMMQGPQSSSTSSSSSSTACDSISSAGQQQPGSSPAAAATCSVAASSDVTAALSAGDLEAWLDSSAFCVLAALVASYDRPDVLARGLHMLTQQQLMAAENTVAATAAAEGRGAAAAGTQGSTQQEAVGKGSKGSSQAAATNKKAEKAAMGRALLLLERVFLWRQQQQQAAAAVMPHDSSSSSTAGAAAAAAAAGGVCQYLLGLSELLRPAANCSVEWRCAALAAMQAVVEDFTESHTDDRDLELQLWCDGSVEGLLFCASHDPSIQARRAAVQLLQHVVLPSSSGTAKALVRCLASTLSDKDSGVSGAALQLFLQLPATALCNALTAAQWATAVQACLGVLCGPSSSGPGTTQQQASAAAVGCGGRGPGKGARQQQSAAAARGQFAGLLRAVLLPHQGGDRPGAEVQQQQQQVEDVPGLQWLVTQGGRVVGVQGCKQVLLLLLLEPGLADSWQTLVDNARGGV